MKKIILTSLATALVASGTTPILPMTAAMAESGSRLCGWTAPTKTGALGLLYEARENDASYTQQCNDAINGFMDKIKSDPNLSQLTWTKRSKTVCQDVGPMFQSSNSPKDMCNQMTAKNPYNVQKDSASNTTVYKKV